MGVLEDKMVNSFLDELTDLMDAYVVSFEISEGSWFNEPPSMDINFKVGNIEHAGFIRINKSMINAKDIAGLIIPTVSPLNTSLNDKRFSVNKNYKKDSQ